MRGLQEKTVLRRETHVAASLDVLPVNKDIHLLHLSIGAISLHEGRRDLA